MRFKHPSFKDDNRGFVDDGDDEFGGDEFEGNADIADMHEKGKGTFADGDSEDNIDEDLDFGVGQVVKNDEQELL